VTALDVDAERRGERCLLLEGSEGGAGAFDPLESERLF